MPGSHAGLPVSRSAGQPAKVDLRDVFNAILYLNRTGIPWKYLPHDFTGHGTVYFYYAAWRARESSASSTTTSPRRPA